jgi:hypothetical protein
VRKWTLEFCRNKNKAQKQDNLASDLRIQFSNIKPNIKRICEEEEKKKEKEKKRKIILLTENCKQGAY